MAITPSSILANLQAARKAAPFPLEGVPFDTLAMGIAVGVCAWAVSRPQNVALVGSASGTIGAGTIPKGSLLIPPNPSLVIQALGAAGLVGPLGVSLGSIVGLAVPRALSSVGSYTGVSPGVGTGTDVSRVSVSNAPALVASLQQTLGSFAGQGPAMANMALGLGNGIAACVALGTGTGNVVGASGPTANTAVTTSFLV